MYLARLLVFVASVFVKPFELYPASGEIRSAEYLNEGEYRLGFVLFDKNPRVPSRVLEHISYAVLISRADNMVILIELGDLSGDSVPVLLRNSCDVKLIAERPDHSNVAPCCKGSRSADGMVRAVGNVRSHCGNGVAYRRTVLYFQTLYRVRIVRTPYLRREIEHTRIEPCAAARAVLEQDMRIIRRKAVHNIVNAEDISVPKLALPVCREGGRAYLGELAVHIPFYILDICAVEYFFHHTVDMIADFLV